MASFKVIDSRRVISPEPGREGQFDWLITYKLDEFRVYTVPIRKDPITAEDVVAAVRADLEAMKQFTGQEFQL